MENKRIYPSTQLIVALDAKVLKLYLYILSWSSRGDVKYYPKQFAKACKTTEEEVEKCLQSLIDAKLIIPSNHGGTWIFSVNVEQNQKYYEIPIKNVYEGKGIPMASTVTWNKVDSNTKSNANTIDDMSKEQMKRMLLMLQAQLKEEEEVEKIVVSSTVNNDDVDSLPF